MLLFFCVYCTFEIFFSAITSIIIFVICRSAKKYADGVVNEENAEANVLHV